ncbi:hypothetical protein MVES_000106 [Malassezia vespertilionis]|uniref:HORMA domain-containing protein n=1 Tax=Malassezia vespertilionis TaxID=2020962 RepID=A0A2N1JG80_9BASI|nr:hypothetical protein MVES_000106 [Malassezia vespertilionis]
MLREESKPERDRVSDGPMTYNETIRAIGDLIECALHTILCVRGVYPKDVFVRCRQYDAPVYQSRHPGLNEYIGNATKAILHELDKASVRSLVIAIHHEAYTDVPYALERYVFSLGMLLPDTDLRNRDLVIRGNVSRASMNLAARELLLQILTLEATLAPLGADAYTFRILLETEDGHVPSASSANSACVGPWIAADGAPFYANSTQDGLVTVSMKSLPTENPTLPIIHPLKLGVHVEQCNNSHIKVLKQPSSPSLDGYVPTQPTASSEQRDLDDPLIELGASQGGIPLRKRKLFTQPLDAGGPISDASSEDDSDSSGNLG